jgi:hypothetical protein
MHQVGYLPGILWTSNRPDADTSTWQHTTLTRYIHGFCGIRTRNPSKWEAADPRIRPRGRRDRPFKSIVLNKDTYYISIHYMSIHYITFLFTTLPIKQALNFPQIVVIIKGRWAWVAQPVQQLATDSTIRGSNPVVGEIFLCRPEWPYRPPSLLYDVYRLSFLGVKLPGRGVEHPLLYRAEVKERLELNLYSPFGSSLSVLGWPFPLNSIIKRIFL